MPFLTFFRSKVLLAVPLALLISGCSQIQFIAQSAKTLGGNIATNDYGDYGPRYKIGSTYSIKGRSYSPSEDYDHVETGIASWYGPNFHGKLTANGGRFDMYKISAAHRTLPLPSVVVVTNLENGRRLKIVVNDRGPYAHDRVIDLSKRSAELLGMRVKGTALVRVEILADESKALKTYMKTNGRQGRLPSNAMASHYTNLTNSAKRPVNNKRVTAAPLGSVSSVVKSKTALLKPKSAVKPSVSQNRTSASKSSNPVIESRPETPMAQGTFVQAGIFSKQKNALATVKMLKKYGIVRMDVLNTDSGKRLYRVRIGPIRSSDVANQILQGVQSLGFPDAVALFINQ